MAGDQVTEIYGVTGMPLAGKTTVADAFKQEGFEVLDMGDVVRKEMDKRGKEPEETGSFVNGLRDDNGMDAIAQLSVPYLEDILQEESKIIITGMRSWEEKERFERETGKNIEVVAVWASRMERKKRKERRKREEDIKGDEFHERDLREIRNGVGKLMAFSDYMIKNDAIEEDKLQEKALEIAEVER